MLFYQRRFITVFWLYSGAFHYCHGWCAAIPPRWTCLNHTTLRHVRLIKVDFFTLVYFRYLCFTGCWYTSSAPSIFVYIRRRPLTQDECENRFYLWNIMVYLKNTVAKWIGFLALIWCYYSKNLGQSDSQSRILIVTSDTQTSRTSGSTKCRHYAALLTKLQVWWNNFFYV